MRTSGRCCAALTVVAVLLAGCASRSDDARRGAPSSGAVASSAGADAYFVTGGCAHISSLTDLIHSSGSHYTWDLGLLRPAGRTTVVDAGPNLQREVFTGFVFTASAALHGSAPPSPLTVWTAGGTNGVDTTTTDSTLDFATGPAGRALVSLFPSSSLTGQYEFQALPATGTTVSMVTIGCWSATTPVANANQVSRLTARSRRALSAPTLVPVIRYHNGTASGPRSVPARRLPIAAIRQLLSGR